MPWWINQFSERGMLNRIVRAGLRFRRAMVRPGQRTSSKGLVDVWSIPSITDRKNPAILQGRKSSTAKSFDGPGGWSRWSQRGLDASGYAAIGQRGRRHPVIPGCGRHEPGAQVRNGWFGGIPRSGRMGSATSCTVMLNSAVCPCPWRECISRHWRWCWGAHHGSAGADHPGCLSA